MNCKLIVNKIPLIIKRELHTDERVSLIEHIKSCDECRSEYHKYLKMFYAVDYKIVQPESELEKYLIDISHLNIKQPKSRGFIWAIAAAFLILFISMLLMTQISESPDKIISNHKKIISQKIINEDWQEISKTLQNQLSLNKIAGEKIALNLLLAKLNLLEQQGIDQLKVATESEKSLMQEVEVRLLISKIKKYQKYKSDISIKEISEYLSLI